MADVMQTPTDDILIQGDPSALYSFTASSAVSGGSVVKASGDMKVVMAGVRASGLVGVSLYEIAANEAVAVAGPGCIVRCCASGTIPLGRTLFPCGTKGRVSVLAGDQLHKRDNESIGVSLSAASDVGAVKVLIK